MSKEFKVPEQWTGTLYVMMSIRDFRFGEINVYDFDASDADEILLTTVEHTIQLPKNIDVRKCVADNLKNAKEKVLAEAQVKANEIQQKIDSLLMITYEAAE